MKAGVDAYVLAVQQLLQVRQCYSVVYASLSALHRTFTRLKITILFVLLPKEADQSFMPYLWDIAGHHGYCPGNMDIISFSVQGPGDIFLNVRQQLIAHTSFNFAKEGGLFSKSRSLLVYNHLLRCRALEAKIDAKRATTPAGPFGEFNVVRTIVDAELRVVSYLINSCLSF